MSAVLVSLPWAAIVGVLLHLGHSERSRNTIERAELLQRIQAPAVAVAQHVQATDPVTAEPDDDDPAFTNIP